MNSFNFNTDLGLERIAREGALILINNINTDLAARDATWATLDQDLATAQGINYVACTSDQVQPSLIHVGHRPSFIENKQENYPNLCVMAYTSKDSPYRNYDQGEDISILFYVEGMVKQGPYNPTIDFSTEAEILVNKKVQRLMESTHRVISKNHNLNGLIEGFEGAPNVVISDCMRRSDLTSNGASDYYWSMFRLEYTVTRSLNTYY